MIFFAATIAALVFTSCGGGPTNNTKQEDSHRHEDGTVHKGAHHDHGDDHDHDHDLSNDHDDDHDHGSKEKSSENVDEIVFSKQQAEAVGLQLMTVQPGTFNNIIKTSGQLQSAQGDEVTLVATANGVVSFSKLSIAAGAVVKAGEPVLTISSRNLAEGDPAQKTKLAYEVAQREYNRAESLLKDTLISRKDFEQIRLNYQTAKIAYDALATSHTSRGVSVASPINGFIKNRLVGEGEYVTTGQPIVTVSQNRKLQLRAEVSEKYYKNLPSITSGNFKTPYDQTLYKLSELKGRLLSYGRSSDGASFYIPVTFEFDNIGQMIPGSFVEVYLLAAPMDNVISIPLSSLVEEQGLYFVFIQLDEEGYKKQEVSIGDDNGQDVLILSGLRPGDRVVTKGATQVKLAANSSVIPEGHSH